MTVADRVECNDYRFAVIGEVLALDRLDRLLDLFARFVVAVLVKRLCLLLGEKAVVEFGVITHNGAAESRCGVGAFGLRAVKRIGACKNCLRLQSGRLEIGRHLCKHRACHILLHRVFTQLFLVGEIDLYSLRIGRLFTLRSGAFGQGGCLRFVRA